LGLILIIFLIILFFLLLKLNIYKTKGSIGELRVAKQLMKLPEDEYFILNDLLIETSKGSSQIDHVVVSIYGIFVIETKNYNGWIHGNENSEYWTQSIYRYKTKFRNPIKQNWAHVYALREVLSDFENLFYYPIIVFAGSGELLNVTSNIPVLYDYDLIDVILCKRNVPSISVEKAREITDRLNNINILDKKYRKNHVYQVHKNISDREDKIESLICPKCNGRLVIRDGKYGEFYGCSNYPNCKFTQNI